ncbi:CYTH and CHAD domain-containing protein [Phenylobacterium montanum]|uniref:CHAD domain-containing protein n=1 Tax=Phenylobacterium montanum TaxID=2823693 RepID=A0A975ITH6_9CAUL|nr:CYTH and CHAD domain-containing protein [Caulobacter sp. S6]QUD86474.1 CHAD domain-containing protein [Caulobacter sp. S6]
METELKFVVDAQGAERLRADLKLPGDGERLRSVYFDTPDMDLKADGFVLRVREAGDQRIQGVKQSIKGGAFTRHEWEKPIEGEGLDFDALDETPLGERLGKKRREALAPTFEVDVRRAKRTLEFQGAEIEVALDEGEVRTVGRREAIRELELELISGSPAALFALARTLVSSAATLSFRTKSSRGFALARDKETCAAALAGPALKPGQTAQQGFHDIAAACLAQIAANAEVLRERRDGEAVHQLRVGARRLRSAILLFRPMLGRAASDGPVAAELRWLAGECDAARNLDVFAEGAFAPVVKQADDPEMLAGFALALERRRTQAHDRARRAVLGDRFRALLLEAAAWIEAGDWTTDAALAEAREERLGDFAADALNKALHRVIKRARALKGEDDLARHRLRVSDKVLRYGIANFATVFEEAKPREVRALNEAAAAAQDALGALTDIVAARSICADLAQTEAALDPDIVYAAGYVAGHVSAGEPAKLKRAKKAVRRLEKAEPFW